MEQLRKVALALKNDEIEVEQALCIAFSLGSTATLYLVGSPPEGLKEFEEDLWNLLSTSPPKEDQDDS